MIESLGITKLWRKRQRKGKYDSISRTITCLTLISKSNSSSKTLVPSRRSPHKLTSLAFPYKSMNNNSNKSSKRSISYNELITILKPYYILNSKRTKKKTKLYIFYNKKSPKYKSKKSRTKSTGL
jgi:hypothetical protein